MLSKQVYVLWFIVNLIPYDRFELYHIYVSNPFVSVGKHKNHILDAKRHVCARQDKSTLESRFLNATKGYGVFATTLIEEGSFIVEYRGVLRDAGTCTPDPYSYYFLYNDTRYCIDASVDDGSLGRLVNDDRNPNSKMKVISVSDVPHLCLFALRDIRPGEEITYDYGGYDLPWRRGTWLYMEGPVQFDNDKENTCVETVPGEIPCSTPTTEQSSREDEGRLCENQLPQIPDQMLITEQMDCEMERPSCSDKGPESQASEEVCCERDTLDWEKAPVQIPRDGEMTTDNKDTSVAQTAADQTSREVEQLESEEGPVSCQPTEQTQETDMEVEACVERQSSSEAVDQLLITEDVQQTCNDRSPTKGKQETQEGGQNMFENEPPHQTFEQMACEEEHLTRSSRPENVEESSPAEQEAHDDKLNSDASVSSDEEFVPESDPESDPDGGSDVDDPVANASDTKAAEEEVVLLNQNNHLVTQAAKENFCFVCGKPSSKIARHLKVHRKHNFEIASAFKLRKSSKERRRILEVLRKRGNYKHNTQVCRNGSGPIKVYRTPKDMIDTQKFEYCMYCKGLYMRKELWRHVRRCTSNPERDTIKNARTRILGLAVMAQNPQLLHLSDDVKKMLCDMNQDEVAQAIRNDEHVLRLAQHIFEKKGNSKERHEFLRHTLRCIGRLLIVLHKKTSLRNLAEAIKPSSFPAVLEAVKELAEFNKETNTFAIPSLARSIGMTLRRFCMMTADKAFAVEDKVLIGATGQFFSLFDDARSQFALGDKKTQRAFNKPPLLPFVRDVLSFHCSLEKAMHCAVRELREKPSAQSYADLSKVMLAQILMFNRRHGDVSHLSIKDFLGRDKKQVSNTSDELTELENALFKHYCKLEVMQKMGGRETIVLTPDMVNAMTLLIERRKQCGVSDDNGFVFGHVKGRGYYRGENALGICSSECGAVNPDQLVSTEFSKHLATLTQVLSLKNHELAILAKFIGHDISVRKEYYRQPEATARLAKICKLILAIEKGSASDLLGQSLDDIVLTDEINESDSEVEDFEYEKSLLFKKSTTSKRHKNCRSTPKDGAEERRIQSSEEQETLEQPRKILKRKPWTKEERLAVVKHFKKHIYHAKLATVMECRRCQMLEHPTLNRRSTQNIRDFVRNMGKSFKRRMEARTHMSTSPVDLLKDHMDPPDQEDNPDNSSIPSPHKVHLVN